MDFEQYSSLFRAKAKISGFSEENIVYCLNYAKPLIENCFPVIYNTANLAALVGYKVTYIKKSILYTNYFYRSFQIKKKNGKLRTLKEPLPSLKEIQNWILINILYNISVSKYAKAYVRKRNIIENVKYHKSKNKVLTLDIENFFGSIKRERVETIFRKIGYSFNIANLLSKLCCCDGCLPQGSPTSPYLSNIYLNEFDEAVAGYCRQSNIRYTRYADDMAFSGTFDEKPLIEFVIGKLAEIDLKLNLSKVKIMTENSRQIINRNSRKQSNSIAQKAAR